MKNSARVTYNKIVNVLEDGEISVLDTIFMYKNGFKGATGSRFYPVSEAQYKQMTTLSAIEEELRERVSEDDIPFKYKEHKRGYYKNPYGRWAQDIKANDGAESFMFDTSYSELWDMLRDELGLSEEEAYIFECVGGGRMFDKNYQGNYNAALSDIIRKYEN